MPQGRRTVQVRLPDGSLSKPYPADMPPAEILAAVEREIASKGPQTSGVEWVDKLGKALTNLSPAARLQSEQYGTDQSDAIPGFLRFISTIAPMAIPGAGLPAVAARTAAGVLPNVAAAGIESKGDMGEMAGEAGYQLALSGLGEGVGRMLSNPAVQKAAIKTSGFFTGPFSYARNRNQYDDWAESLMRLNNTKGVLPAGRQRTIDTLKRQNQSQINEILARMDAAHGAPVPSSATDLAPIGSQVARGAAPSSAPSVLPTGRINVPQAVLDTVREHAQRVPRGNLQAVASERTAINEGTDVVADLLARNQPATTTAKEAQKELLAPLIRNALENSLAHGDDVGMNMDVFGRTFGYDPFDIKPSNLHTLNKGLGQDIEQLLEAASQDRRLPREGSLAMKNDIHQALRSLLQNADETGEFARLQREYSDLMNADKFRGAVRRDPAMFPMRAGFGGAVSSGVGRAASGIGLGTALGGPAGGALGGLAAVIGLEPSVLYSLLYTAPKLGAKYGPSAIRAAGNALRPVPSHETEE